jgi:GntR family transcriptional regulator
MTDEPTSVLDPDGRVSRASQIPLYHQIANDIRRRITDGTWPPGKQIPSESELVRRYGASRVTIRQAISVLAQEDLVARERGRGSFVRDPAITARPSRLTSFSIEMRAKGIRPSSQVLSWTAQPANEEIATHLGLLAGDRVLRLERIRHGDEQPVGIQVAWLPATLFPGLLDVDFSNESLYAVLERRYGTMVDDAEETFTATLLDSRTAELLSVPVSAPAFLVERLGRSGGRPVEFTRSLMRGDRYRVRLRLRRPAHSVGPLEDHAGSDLE